MRRAPSQAANSYAIASVNMSTATGVTNVSLVGSDLPVTWNLISRGLRLSTDAAPPLAPSYTFRLHLNGATAEAIDAPTRGVRARIAAA